ncbi:MAG: hypothetical protein QM539_04395 [Alphaproteobacteria bacterium]|nr:hypothetical protein [Alphaproteobacteria bacterium]
MNTIIIFTSNQQEISRFNLDASCTFGSNIKLITHLQNDKRIFIILGYLNGNDKFEILNMNNEPCFKINYIEDNETLNLLENLDKNSTILLNHSCLNLNITDNNIKIYQTGSEYVKNKSYYLRLLLQPIENFDIVWNFFSSIQ